MTFRIRAKTVRKLRQRISVPVLAIVLIGASLPQPARGVYAEQFRRYLPSAAPFRPQVVVAGERFLPQVPAAARPARRTLWVTVTAYSSTVDQTDATPFITASGAHVRRGTIAWNAVSFGTEVRFPEVFGEEVFVVEDRLNARATPWHVDLWVPTREEAVQWGVKILKVEVL